MAATGSTRTATRWSSCEATPRSPRRSSFLLGAALLLAAGCVATTTTAYVPTAGQPRLTTDDARDEIDALLRAECPRLVKAGKPSGESHVSVDVDASGNVSAARLQTSSGDEEMDKIFGGTAARLHFQTTGESSSATTSGRLRMGWSCSGDAAVTTIQLL
jgi:outer membrane biosynthesis protein TonB